jgi:type III secretion system FlhB-like substrate exporter
MKKHTPYDNYESSLAASVGGDMLRISQKVADDVYRYEEHSGRRVYMEKNPARLKNLIGNDVREAVPPRIYSIISSIVTAIEEIEEDENVG